MQDSLQTALRIAASGLQAQSTRLRSNISEPMPAPHRKVSSSCSCPDPRASSRNISLVTLGCGAADQRKLRTRSRRRLGCLPRGCGWRKAIPCPMAAATRCSNCSPRWRLRANGISGRAIHDRANRIRRSVETTKSLAPSRFASAVASSPGRRTNRARFRWPSARQEHRNR